MVGKPPTVNRGVPITNHQSPTTRERALSLSRSVFDFLRTSHAGTVLATFQRSCYLDLDGRIVALVAPDLLNGPLNILITVPAESAFDRLPVGTVVRSTREWLTIDGALEVSLPGADVWEARIGRWQDSKADALRAHARVVRQVLGSKAPGDSVALYLATLDDISSTENASGPERTRLAMALLRDGLRHRDSETVKKGAQRLAGLGQGLTPSGDDVLAGTLVALTVNPINVAEQLRAVITEAAIGRTTRISTAYLEAAARGEANEAWHHLLAAMVHDDPAPLLAATRRVMAFGETSGADMLAGFLLALDAFFEAN